jgi:hypothetical protein
MSTAHLEAVHAAREKFAAERKTLSPADPEFRAILHVHAEDAEHTGGTRQEVLTAAKRTGVQVILFSDHRGPKPDTWRGVRDGVLFVPGSETGDGFLDVHFAAGKLRFLCHVEERYDAPTGKLHGLEIYNRHTDSTDEKEFERWFAAAMKNPDEWKRVGADLARYPDEIFAGQADYWPEIFAKWDRDAQAHPLTGVAAFNGESHIELPSFQSSRFSIAMWVRSTALPEMTILEGGPGFEIGVEESHPQPDMKRGSPLYVEYGGKRWHSRALIFGAQFHHVVLNVENGAPSLILDGQSVPLDPAGTVPARAAGPLAIGDPHAGKPLKGEIGDLRIYDRPLTLADAGILWLREPVRAILTTAEDKRSNDQKQRLREYFLRYEAPADLRGVFAKLNDLKQRLADLKKSIVTSQVMAEMAKPRETHILARGDYRSLGEKVTPGVPAALPPLPKDAPANRLSLAQWLFSPQHPLTARVAVNRYWQLYFGIGLVKTAEDFGSQGDSPAYRDLLDWLAVEFESKWDVKAMQRLIVTSATYRQASAVSAALLEKDPENRLLARGPRFRLPAEMVRDNALAAAGLIDQRIGGPSVYPYQPAGLWEELSRGEIFTAQEYKESEGADLYRRSMYTFWKRTVPPAALTTFDAPDREKCTSRRLITNTPLQALVLMNDPTYVEAARVLAGRAIHDAGATPQARVRYLFRQTTLRTPSEAELRLLADLAQRRLEHYRKNPALAAKLIAVGASKPGNVEAVELAAWTMVASTILNLDETITKE